MQSKGRARAKPSQYVVMVGNLDRPGLERKYREFQRVELFALQECHHRPEEEEVIIYRPQYSTVQYSTVQYSTVQYSTVQYSTVQYSTAQYSTVDLDTMHQVQSSDNA